MIGEGNKNENRSEMSPSEPFSNHPITHLSAIPAGHETKVAYNMH